MRFIHGNLTGRYQRVQINNMYSSFKLTKDGVPQGSILGPLLLNIFLSEMSLQLQKINIASYVDDNTSYTNGETPSEVISDLKLAADRIFD